MDLYQASLGEHEEDEIELTMEQYQQGKAHFESIVQRRDAARRLADNEDFKALVLDGYLDNEPHRLVELMASGRLNDKVFGDCSRQIQSVADFRNYMKDIMDQGQMAEQELVSLEQAWDIAIAEAEAGE